MIRWLGLSVLLCMLVFWNVACGPTTCKPGEVCPVGTVCKAVGSGTGDITYVCIPANPKSDIGALCMADNYRCLSGYCYMPTQDVKQSYCSRLCDDKEPCPPGFQCQVVGTNLKVCTLNFGSSGGNGCRCGKANASCTSNGHDDCDVAAGYFCLSAGPRDPKAKCVKECSPGISQSCPTGLSCLRSQTGRFLCMASKRGEGGIGDSCADGGKADCLRNYFCYEQYPNDRAAFCSRFCSPYDENDCGKGSVCESPREQDPWLCVPRGRKKIGENCSTEGFLACNSGICAAPQARSRTRFCTERCDRMMTNVLQGSSVVSLPASIVIFVTNPQVETSGRFATRTVARIAKAVFVSLLLPVRSTASVLRSVTMLCAHVPAVTNATKTTSTAFPTQGQKRLERSAQARMSVFLGPALLPAVVETITVLSVVPKTSSVLMVTSVACWNSLRSSASQNRRPKASRGTHAPEVRGIVQPTIASTTS